MNNGNAEKIEQLRRDLRAAGIPARVQTYRTNDEISIYPVNKSAGWNADQVAAVKRIIDAAELSTLLERVLGTRYRDSEDGIDGFRYLRFKN